MAQQEPAIQARVRVSGEMLDAIPVGIGFGSTVVRMDQMSGTLLLDDVADRGLIVGKRESLHLGRGGAVFASVGNGLRDCFRECLGGGLRIHHS